MVSLHAQCLSGWAWPWERNFSLDKQVLLFGRWQRSLWLHLHELKSEYTNHFYLHPLLCLTTAEHPSVVRPISLWYHLNLSPSSPCTMSLSIPRPRSRQHNCKHIYYTLESHTFHPPISFSAWHLCFVLISSEQAIKPWFHSRSREESLCHQAQSFLAEAVEGTQAAWGCETITPQQSGRMHMVCFAPSERLPLVLGGFYEMV